MMKKGIVFLNDKYLPAAEAVIPAIIPGVMYGLGLFETMRSYYGRIIYLDAHIKRIMHSCRVLGIKTPYTLSRIRHIIGETVKLNKIDDAYVKLIFWKAAKQARVLVIAKKYSALPSNKYIKGYSACVSRFRQSQDYFLSGIKSTNRILYELSFQEAQAKGFDEALLLNTKGSICEGTRSNIFLVEGSSLFTPGLDCGCLPGVTRKVIFDFARKNHLKVYESGFTVYDLYKAGEAFLTNSLIGVMPLTKIEKKKICYGKAGRVTKLLMQSYAGLYKNEFQKNHIAF